MSATAQDFATSLKAETGLEIDFFGQHMSTAELDAEFFSRVEPAKLAGIAALNESAWFGYRFMHPGLRVYLFTYYYSKAYKRTMVMFGRRHAQPKFLRANPLAEARKADVTGLITATFTADAHGIPYDIWCDTMMEQCLRNERSAPLQPCEMYHERMIGHVLDKWKERNESGVYVARAPQLLGENYEDHPVQLAYQNWLCEQIAGKGNRAFWVGRLLGQGQLNRRFAVNRYGADIVDEADRYK